jgi:hypothetical protein
MSVDLSEYLQEEPYDVPIDPVLLQEDANSPPSPHGSAVASPLSPSATSSAAASPRVPPATSPTRRGKAWTVAEDARLVVFVDELGKDWAGVEAKMREEGYPRSAEAIYTHYQWLRSRADAQSGACFCVFFPFIPFSLI